MKLTRNDWNDLPENTNPIVIAFLKESERLEENNERKQRRHTISFEQWLYEGLALADPVTPESRMLDKEYSQHIRETLQKLSPTQCRRLQMLADGYKISQIAKIENVHRSAVAESIESARKKFKDFF